MPDITELKPGARLLYQVGGHPQLHEGAVSEFSPSNKYVRLGLNWARVDQVWVIEVLPAEKRPARAEKPATPPEQPEQPPKP